MKAETLKKSILQYAMQGKLVPQDPNDEPASVLLERIKAEKEQLIKDGKIKKEKPLPPITEDEIPYELPQGWVWVRLGDVCKLSQGNKVKNVQLPLLNAKYLRTKLEKIVYTEGILVNNGDYLILVDGENSGEVFHAFEDGIMGSTFKLLNISNYISLNFVLKILQFYQDTFRESKKGAAIPHLDKTLFKNIVIGVPPLAEQQRIVEKLEQILPLVEEYGKNEEKLSKLNSTLPDKIKQSILQYAVQGKLIPQNPSDEPASELLKRIKAEKEQLIKDGKIKKEKPLPPITEDEIPFEIPNAWEWVRLDDLSQNIHYGYNGSANFNLKEPKLVRITDIQNNSINWNNVPACEIKENDIQNYKLQQNDILIARTGGTMGKTYLVEEVPSTSIFASYLIRCIPLSINAKYLKVFMESPFYWQQLYNKASGTGQPNVNGTSLKSLIVPLPPLAEQQRIIAKVEELLSIVDNLKV